MELKKLKPRKLNRIAEDLVRTGVKVYRYRVDVLDPSLAKQLSEDTQALDEVRKDKNAARENLEAAVEKLDATLCRAGGKFYPHRGWSENVEMLLVGAFLVIGIRTFFFQPFIIPTNSMYPSFNGMTYVNYIVSSAESSETEKGSDQKNPPPIAFRIFRKLLFGATNIKVVAEADGEVHLRAKRVTGRKWFIFPTPKIEFKLEVGSIIHRFQVPVDFHNITNVLEESGIAEVHKGYGGSLHVQNMNRSVKKGETILNFEILSGDALFVDRMSYHFRKPQVGDPFVFETDLVKSNSPEIFSILSDTDPGKYYIKRLVGKGGDELRVDKPVLYRNGNRITGAYAFEKNASADPETWVMNPRVPMYPGYSYGSRILKQPTDKVRIPLNHYFAMGDNSPNSSDSRVWGFVPKNAVIGRAVFIYYPFTKRWGISR